MSKNNNINISKRENHKIPDAEIRGYVNQLKKEEKRKDSKSLEILNAQIATCADLLGRLVTSSVIGLIVVHFFPQYDSGGYWIGLFLLTGFIHLFKLNAKKVKRDDYIPSWKKER